MTRDISLIKAELVDAMQDYAHIFKEKSGMELERFDSVLKMAADCDAGGIPFQDVGQSQDFAKRYQLLEMRHDELKIRIARLLIERGRHASK